MKIQLPIDSSRLSAVLRGGVRVDMLQGEGLAPRGGLKQDNVFAVFCDQSGAARRASGTDATETGRQGQAVVRGWLER